MAYNKIDAVYIGSLFINAYNSLRQVDNQAIHSEPMTLSEFYERMSNTVLKERWLDVVFIDPTAIIDSQDYNFVDAVEFLKLNHSQLRIIVLAPDLSNPRDLKRLVQLGVYDIVTHIRESDDVMEQFGAQTDILDSALNNVRTLVDVKYIIDMPDTVLSQKDKDTIKSKGKRKKSRKAQKISMFLQDNPDTRQEFVNLFDQDSNYIIEENEIIDGKTFADVSRDSRYLIVQDPTLEQWEQLKPKLTDKFFAIALYTQYNDYQKHPKGDFAVLYSSQNTSGFINSLENQIKSFQNSQELSETAEMLLKDFIPEGYVKKKAWWFAPLIITSIMLIVITAGLITVKTFNLARREEGQKIKIQEQLRVQSILSSMVLDFKEDILVVNPGEKVDFRDNIKNLDLESKLTIPDFDTSELKFGEEKVVEYTLEKEDQILNKDLKILIKDTLAPKLELSEKTVVFVRGESKFVCDSFIKSAIDNVDGDLVDKVTCSSKLDESKEYEEVVYEVTDKAGNKAEEILTLVFRDKDKVTEIEVTVPTPGNSNPRPQPQPGGNTAPEVKPQPEQPVDKPPSISVPSTINIKASGSTSLLQNALTSQVKVTASRGYTVSYDWAHFQPSEAGSYPVQITATDSSGRKAYAQSTIVVTD